MASSGFIAFLFAVGLAAWVYSKLMHRTNSTQNSLMAAGVVGVVGFIIFFLAFHSFIKS